MAAYSPLDAAAASGVLVPGTVTVYPAYRTNRVSILDAIDQPSASRNLSQNQIKRQFTDQELWHQGCNCSNYLAGSVHVIWRSDRSLFEVPTPVDSPHLSVLTLNGVVSSSYLAPSQGGI